MPFDGGMSAFVIGKILRMCGKVAGVVHTMMITPVSTRHEAVLCHQQFKKGCVVGVMMQILIPVPLISE